MLTAYSTGLTTQSKEPYRIQGGVSKFGLIIF